jgi:hypothetical protein
MHVQDPQAGPKPRHHAAALRLAMVIVAIVLIQLGFIALVQADPQPATARTTPVMLSPIATPRTVTGVISGVVIAADGPVAGAVVRVHLTPASTLTGDNGRFMLSGVAPSRPVTVTAAKGGFYIGAVKSVEAGSDPVTITLKAHYTTDTPDYDWAEHGGVKGSAGCGLCHTAYAEWQQDSHSQSAKNYRFLTLYSGTDIQGKRSPPIQRDTMGVPLPPDLTQPYFGPGFKLDFPSRAGSCATCHTPLASNVPNNQNCGWSGCHSGVTQSYSSQMLPPGTEPLDLKGVAAEGISCEFCHKIGDAYINRKTGVPYDDMPGILSYRLYRPHEGEDLLFGPLDDVVRTDTETKDSYSALIQESAFCAGCHYGVLGGVVGNMQVTGGVLIYSSFSEWLASPYSQAGPEGRTCQDCHMPNVAGGNYIVFPEKGGPARDPSQIHDHRMAGGSDAQFLRSAVTLTATAVVTDGLLAVEVAIVNDKTGHHVPTDSALRHLILIAEAADARGNPLALVAGPQLPGWAGEYAGLPGRTYAKVLRDEWTGEQPTAAIWRPVTVVEDTRIAAFTTDRSRYVFAVPADGVSQGVTVRVRLLYRRAPRQLMEWKGWPDRDVVMAQQAIEIGVQSDEAAGQSASASDQATGDQAQD